MKKLLITLLLLSMVTGCGVQQIAEETTTQQTDVTQTQVATSQTLVDMAGRTVTVPLAVDTVFCATPEAAIYLYQMAPELLLGWNYEPTDDEKVLMLDDCAQLPSYGMGSGINYEAVIASGAQMTLYAFSEVTPDVLETVDGLEQTLNMPVYAIDATLVNAAQTYRAIGQAIGQEARGEALASYTETLFDSIQEIPEGDRKTVYYGNGTDSLETAPIGSASAQEFELLYIENVADLGTDVSTRVSISSEQILAWNPEIIILNGEQNNDLTEDQAVLDFMSNPLYADLTAVQNETVYGVPKSPFSLIARPSGPNRLMGLQWLKALVYPEIYTQDMTEVTKEFYALFYHVDLTDTQVADLLYQADEKVA